MNVRVIIPPDPLITVGEAKESLRVDHSEEDQVIAALVGAASEYLDGPNGWLGRAIMPQKIEVTFDRFHGRSFCLPVGPVMSIESIKYLDLEGQEQVVNPDGYFHDGGAIWLADSFSFPAVSTVCNATRVTYMAGLDEAPSALKVAVKMHVGTLYQNRESVGDPQTVLPHAYEALCAAHKVWHL